METGWLHDLFLFLTAVFAAYAAWKTNKTGQKVEEVSKQTDGLARALAKEAKAAGVAEGIEIAHREGDGGAPPVP